MNRTDKIDYTGYLYIRSKILNEGITPSLREISRKVGYSSPRSVQLMLDRLQNKGLLSYSDGKIQLSMEDTPEMNEQTIEVPLIGSISCGTPLLAEQEVEAIIQISTKIAKPGSKYFLLRARGSSMNKSGINDGDLVLVKQQPTANPGEMVVALINDDATIKHFSQEANIVVLKPNSTDPQHKPIIVTSDIILQGIVVFVLPKTVI